MLTPDRTDKTRVIACGALAREIRDLCAANDFAHIELTCLPAILHNRPERIAPRLEPELKKAKDEGYGDVLVGYGDCGTGGAIAHLCEEYGARMLPGAHCYAFYAGVDAFAARNETRAFYLTDFLARHFESVVVEPLKLRAHPELVPMMFGNYERVVYLSQATPAPYIEHALKAAEFLGLDFVHEPIGYGALCGALSQVPRHVDGAIAADDVSS